MGAEHEEIAVHLLHIDGQMRRRLRAVHDDLDAVRMCQRADVLHRRDLAQHIADLRDDDEAHTIMDGLSDIFHRDAPMLIQFDIFHARACFPRRTHEGQHAAGMLRHIAEDDVPFLQPGAHIA